MLVQDKKWKNELCMITTSDGRDGEIDWGEETEENVEG